MKIKNDFMLSLYSLGQKYVELQIGSLKKFSETSEIKESSYHNLRTVG